MLVISREVGEWIQIGPDIRVFIGRIRQKTVRIAIEAPSHIRIMRSEVIEREASEGCRHKPRGMKPPKEDKQ